MISWCSTIFGALLAAQLTRRGKWRRAVKLINSNTQHKE